MAADVESEKKTRADANKLLHDRFDKLEARLRHNEYFIAGVGGGLLLIQFFVSWLK